MLHFESFFSEGQEELRMRRRGLNLSQVESIFSLFFSCLFSGVASDLLHFSFFSFYYQKSFKEKNMKFHNNFAELANALRPRLYRY